MSDILLARSFTLRELAVTTHRSLQERCGEVLTWSQSQGYHLVARV